MKERDFLDAAFAGKLNEIRMASSSDPELLRTQSDGSFYEKGTSALHLASAAGHIDVVDFLVSRGADVNTPSQDGSPLMMAVWGGHAHIVERLLAADADVNYQTPAGVSALHQAAVKNLVDIARTLIQRGAQVNVQTTTGHTDMYSGSPEVRGETPLHIAARHGHLDMIRLLLKNSADQAIPDKNGKTPYQWADRYHQERAKAALSQGRGADMK